MKAAIAKTEEHRLNKFVWANVGQPENRDKPATETKNPAQFTRQTLQQPQDADRWLDRSAKRPQYAGEGVPLGECRLNPHYSPSRLGGALEAG
jgi:hypothetical protein